MPNAQVKADPLAGFELYQERRPAGLVRRFFITLDQLLALFFGGLNVWAQELRASRQGSPLLLVPLWITLFFIRPFLDKRIIYRPFPVQFRLRLEILGPTYIKLGQILSLREDLLPKPITDELKNLLDRLPVVTPERFQQLIEADLQRPLDTIFRWIDPRPLGSASLAQTHRARLLTGERVVVKVLKPGVRHTVRTDTILLRLFGHLLQVPLARFQPARLVDEFSRYTLREVDLRFEADNAETFAANFKDQPDIRFPKIYRQFSNLDVLCMEYFKGIKPDAHAAAVLTMEQKEKVIQLGVASIIQMVFKDGFFHADLHPGNMVIFRDASVGYIDLGMVGAFDREMQQRLFYFFYSLVAGEPEAAARYLASLSMPGKNTDLNGFQRAASGLFARWLRANPLNRFSTAQAILQSVLLAGQYHIVYPGEMILMIKALITLEGVANQLEPGFDVVKASRSHVQRLLWDQFNPIDIARASLLIVPEVVELLNRSPLVLTEGLKRMESSLKRPPGNPYGGLQSAIVLASSLIAAAVFYAAQAPWPFYVIVVLIAIIGLARR